MSEREKWEEGLRPLPLCQYEFLPAEQVPFSEKVREICRRECPRYGKSWSCPPAVGTVESCQKQALGYQKALVFTTVAAVEDPENFEQMLSTSREHQQTARKVKALAEQLYGDVLLLSSESCGACAQCAYPKACRQPKRMIPCIESYGIVAPLLAEQCGIEFSWGTGTVTWFGLVFFGHGAVRPRQQAAGGPTGERARRKTEEHMNTTRTEEMEINLQAMRKMTALLECLETYGYRAHPLEVYLVRLLFCLFANDAGIFPEGLFSAYLGASRLDGGDLSERLAALFQILDTPQEDRSDPDPELARFPYVDGKLFAGALPVYSFDGTFAGLLEECLKVRWRSISPAIFGAMFQEIMDQKKRREWGTYYTSEENIEKLIRPLFLDGLEKELDACRGNRRKLQRFHQKLQELCFFDPACGCGNFLIVAYRELRRLELAVLRELYDTSQRVLDVDMYCKVDVGQFYGIEYEPFQAQIARVGMWLTDHQMNLEAADFFGMCYARIPLVNSAKIVQGNALDLDWEQVVPREKTPYIIGNPPFVGARLMNREQKQDLRRVFVGMPGVGNMDYVTAWYRKAAAYMAGTDMQAAFVSTNSIAQGEQAGLLWNCLTHDFGMELDFAWRSFVWNNEARGQAKVHCVILGFSSRERKKKGPKRLFGEAGCRDVSHINPYLAPGPDVFLKSRRKPLWPVPSMVFGSMANDGGHLLLSSEEAEAIRSAWPEAAPWIRRFCGSVEYIEGQERYCLWLKGVEPEAYAHIPAVKSRVEAVRRFRLVSQREATRKLAERPELFGEIRQPEEGSYILVPRVSSEHRPYIPMGFLPAEVIASDAVFLVPEASLVLFGILGSAMHMAWVRGVAGRLKSDYRYSASVVYNHFPFPDLEAETGEVEQAAEALLAVQERLQPKWGAALYGADTMPEAFRRSHARLDEAVDRLYGQVFSGEEERLAFLFSRYRDRSRSQDGAW